MCKEYHPLQRQVAQSHQQGHHTGVDRKSHLIHEENRIMRVERRVEVIFDGGQIYGFVFQTEVIAMREKTQEGQKHENGDFGDFYVFCRL